MAEVSWFVFCVLAVAAMMLRKQLPGRIAQEVMVRVAAFLWLAAGTVGLSGFIGNLIVDIVQSFMSLLDNLGSAAVGTGLGWLVALIVSGAWICGMLPDTWVRSKRQDWLIVAGLILPTVLSSIPGETGQMLREVMSTLGESIADMTRELMS